MFGSRLPILSEPEQLAKDQSVRFLDFEDSDDLAIFKLQRAESLAEKGSMTQKAEIEEAIEAKTQERLAEGGSDSSDSSSDSSVDDSSATEESEGAQDDSAGAEEEFDMDFDEEDTEPESEDNPEEEKDEEEKEDEEDSSKDDEEKEKEKEEEEKQKEKDKEKEEKEKEASKESAMLRLSLENDQAAYDFVMNVGSGIVNVVKQLAILGINYGPSIASALYKGVVTGFRLLAKAYIHSVEKIERWKFEQGTSLKNISEEIEEVKSLIKKVQNVGVSMAPEGGRGSFNNPKIASALTMAGRTDVAANIEAHTRACEGAISSIHSALRKEIIAIETMTNRRNRGGDRETEILENFGPPRNFKEADSQTFGVPYEGLTIYRYSENFISDLVLTLQLPEAKKTPVGDLAKSFSHSRSSLILDQRRYKPADKLNYMELDGVAKLVASLENLLAVLQKQQQLYDVILSDKNRQRSAFRDFFNDLARSKEKIGIGESQIDVVVTRNKFVDDTYLVAIMDSQALSVRVIGLALEYARENLKRLM